MNAYSLRAQIDTALTYPRSPGEIVRVMPLNGAGGKVDWQRTGPTSSTHQAPPGTMSCAANMGNRDGMTDAVARERCPPDRARQLPAHRPPSAGSPQDARKLATGMRLEGRAGSARGVLKRHAERDGGPSLPLAANVPSIGRRSSLLCVTQRAGVPPVASPSEFSWRAPML